MKLVFLLSALILATLSTTAAAQIVVGPSFDLCLNATADATIGVSSSTDISSHSPSGGYGYTNLCGRWVVDFVLAPHTGTRQFEVSAFDLPSSNAFGVPVTAQDCSHYTTYVKYYSKASGATSFTPVATGSYTGFWDGASCQFVSHGAPVQLFANTANLSTTYRMAVGTHLRGSWQQVEASVGEQPPQ